MKNKSFTLIELLVVIAIIGLLASIVLVSMAGIKTKAKFTKLLETSQSINHVLGVYMIGYWGFDDQTNPTKDGSGYSNNAVISGGVGFSSDTPQAAAGMSADKHALIFDGASGSYARVNNAAILNPTKVITLEVWFKHGVAGHGVLIDKPYTSYSSPYYSYMLGLYNDRPEFFLSIGGRGTECVSGDSLSSGSWHYAVATYDGTNMKVYGDGNLLKTCSAPGSITAYDTDLNIGVEPFSSMYFLGLIDEVKIYEASLSIGEIRKHYAEGLGRHQNFAIR